uniref:activating signal cointegrator 1 complex subunit 1-like n=1 Tax=Styela clava TaxID=7725 RepID=UPI00193A360D|nr:activating signal cointegrator 1 complex subunit 1-like [Styela clava]
MDILNSKILNIDGRLYISYLEEEDFVIDEPNEEQLYEEETTEDETLNYEKTSTGFKGSISCPSALYKYVIGSRGATKQKIEYETHSKVIIPQRGQSGDILVKAKSTKDVEAAITRIELLISEKRWKEPFAHFVTIPLNDDVLKEGLNKFKTEVLKKFSGDEGVTDKLFPTYGKLHLTITTLILLDESECERAVNVLQEIKTSKILINCDRKRICVQGIEYMNDDPQAIDVLYAKVSCPDDPNFLQELADHIVSEFDSAGLARKERGHVKLHATVMNTLRTIDRPDPNQKNLRNTNQKRKTFDGKNILKEFEDYYFGEFDLREIHISKRHTVGKDGYYESLDIVAI